MAQIVSQGPCPSPYHDGGEHSEAYTIYDDGSSHCFTCGYHISANAYVNLKERVKNKSMNNSTVKPVPPLPEDAEPLIQRGSLSYRIVSTKAELWLNKYGITNAEIDSNNFMWSDEKQLLIFPVFDNTFGLLMWQGRYFGDKPRHPKYLTRGLKESVVHCIGPDKKGPLVLTEDLISAIKVGRQQIAMPLWGSFLSKEMAQRLSIMWKDVILYLDYDKRDESVKQAVKHSLILGITPLITKLDPKFYSDSELTEILKQANKDCG